MKKGIFIIFILFIFIVLYFFFINSNKNINENSVLLSEENFEESLTSEVSLFYINNKNEIFSEVKKVDSKELINNPYIYVLNLLKEEESIENRINLVSSEIKFIDSNKEGDTLRILVGNNFQEICGEDIITVKEIIKRTMCQFKEVSDIIIENEDNIEL